MLANATQLKGLIIRATDGEIGKVRQFFFDDDTWAIRYLVVETGGWLANRQVLISPFAINEADWRAKRLMVALTRKQVADSPDIDTHQPISRQHEASYLAYYGYPYYWSGPNLWGSAYYPAGASIPSADSLQAIPYGIGNQAMDSHLRSSAALTGYHMEASDGEIGHLDSFLLDDELWAIRYLEVATRNWWPGQKVLVSPGWVEHVSWTDSKIHVALSRDAIQTAPAYTAATPVTREYENRLHLHYGQPPYWANEIGHAASLIESAL